MNQKKAKALRRKIYGDYSTAHRDYVSDKKTGAIKNHPLSLRAKYLKAKRETKNK